MKLDDSQGSPEFNKLQSAVEFPDKKAKPSSANDEVNVEVVTPEAES